jgi:hypothetical protein
MKALLHRLLSNRTTCFALIVLTSAGIAAIAFHKGTRYAEKKLLLRIASDGCFDSWAGLIALREPSRAERMALVLNAQLDYSAKVLARMVLAYPGDVERPYYNVLLKVRDYHKIYGHGIETVSNHDSVETDRLVEQAVTYLESIHNTNTWLPSGGKTTDILREIRPYHGK